MRIEVSQRSFMFCARLAEVSREKIRDPKIMHAQQVCHSNTLYGSSIKLVMSTITSTDLESCALNFPLVPTLSYVAKAWQLRHRREVYRLTLVVV